MIKPNNFLECLTKKDERFNPMKCFKGMIGLACLNREYK